MSDPSTAPKQSISVLARRLAFQPSRPHLVIGLLFLVLGGLITVALLGRHEDQPWRTARTEDLVQILDDLSARQARLDAEAARLAEVKAGLEAGSTSDALAEAQRKVTSLEVLTGTTAVTGPGISATLGGKGVTAALVLNAVQELRDAGAEAIQIGPVRVVVNTWFADGPQGVVADGVALSDPISILAIGDAPTLETALNFPGGVADSVRTGGGQFEAAIRPTVDISVTVPASGS